ncbi:hypothetical protein QAD02_014394 [Eretmocerus hayati]|uniref:Uncharacterized protein n=1 Tax=Eretmocerus hayati TaxID=131215 RepID=A0ACC2P5C5_9HYME|nr:hypothetical protein QAD02_014394 [Eretmocerus hayati]
MSRHHGYSSSDDSDSDSSSSSSDFDAPKSKRRKRDEFGDDDDSPVSESMFDVTLQANFKWNVKNISQICEEHGVGEKIESPIFTVGSNDELKWRFQIYPRGCNELHKNYISVFLSLVASKETKINASFKFDILNKRRSMIKNDEMTEYFSAGERHGIKKLMKTESTYKNLSYDRLTLSCDVKVPLTSKLVAHKMKVVDDLQALLESGQHSDVVLQVENKSLKMHKYILAARSPVFAAMFNHNMTESQENVVKITDVSFSVMKEVLRFAYTGEAENVDTLAKDLLAAADKYALDDLKNICENALFKSVNIDNVVEILNFADVHSAVKLKEQALDFLVTHVNDVIATPSFKSMGDSQSPILAQVVCMMALRQKT